jgi:uncharacterized protein YndB with AHSA1/START domain
MDAAAPHDDLLRDADTSTLPAVPAAVVQRSLDVDARPAELWRMIADPAELATWFATDVELVVAPGGRGRLIDDDGAVRHAVVDELEPERQLVLRWWRDDDGPETASVVTMAVSPWGDGARLVVTEHLLGRPSSGAAAARAGLRATASTAISAWQWRLDLLLLRVAIATEATLARG